MSVDTVLAEVRQRIKNVREYPFDSNRDGWRNSVAKELADKIDTALNEYVKEVPK